MEPPITNPPTRIPILAVIPAMVATRAMAMPMMA